MPRKERVLPSRSPRSLPHVVCTTGGARFGPPPGESGPADPAPFGRSCAAAFPATPATTPPSRAVVVPSIVRRFICASGVFDGDSSDMLPPHPWLLRFTRQSLRSSRVGRCASRPPPLCMQFTPGPLALGSGSGSATIDKDGGNSNEESTSDVVQAQG